MEQFPFLIRKDRAAIRYLVVDDSVFARKNVARMVESFGGEIAGEAGDGCTAITEYDRTSPDMVLMDITMPQMEGIEAAERIVRAHPDARIVMVSSVGYQENIVAALQKGARHFVQKPVKAEILYEVIKYVMGDDAIIETPVVQENKPVKIKLIQPVINVEDAVLAQTLHCPSRVGDVYMEQEVYRRKGFVSLVTF